MTEEKETLDVTTLEVKEINLPPDCHCDAKLVLQGEASSQHSDARETRDDPGFAGCSNPFSLPAAADLKSPLKASLLEGGARRAEGVMADESPPTDDNDPELDRLRAELESVHGQVTRLEHERYLLSRGVPEEDLDYYAFKIEHMEGAKSDFAKAAKEYLKAHPVRRTAVSSGADLTAGSTRRPATSSELMNQLLRNR